MGAPGNSRGYQKNRNNAKNIEANRMTLDSDGQILSPTNFKVDTSTNYKTQLQTSPKQAQSSIQANTAGNKGVHKNDKGHSGG